MYVRRIAVLLLFVLPPGFGCTEKSKTVRVSGTVRLDGKAVPNAVIAYYPDYENDATGGFGTSDEQGVYQVGYPQPRNGLKPGRYRVTVRKEVGGKDIIDAPLRGAGIPSRYANHDSTPIRITVSAEPATYDLALESDKK